MLGNRWMMLIAVVAWLVVGSAHGDDLRAKYGVRSAAAAQHIDDAIALSAKGEHTAAMAAIKKALAVEDTAMMAWFWHATISHDLGDIEGFFRSSNKALEFANENTIWITVNICMNVGLTHGRMGDYQASNIWLSRAVIEDPSNVCSLHWKAFRNMAINRHELKDDYSATLLALVAASLAPEQVQVSMIEAFMDGMENPVCATLLETEHVAYTPPTRTSAPLTDTVTVATEQPVSALLADPAGKWMIGLPAKGTDGYYLITLGSKPALKHLATSTKIVAADLRDDKLYISTQGKEIQILEPTTAKVLKTISTGQHVAGSLAALPAHGLVYMTIGEQVICLNTTTSTFTDTELLAHRVASHPSQRSVYGYSKRDNGLGMGMLMINGRPYLVQEEDWIQSAITRFHVVPDDLLVAQIRAKAASNAWAICVDPAGRFVCLVGGGGYRPEDGSGVGGYGVAVYAAEDFKTMLGYYAIGAYPIGGAINPVTSQLAVVSAKLARVYDLADSERYVEIAGTFAGPVVWSGDGRWLAIAGKSGGVLIAANRLSRQETSTAQAWREVVEKSTPKRLSTSQIADPGTDVKPVKFFAEYSAKSGEQDVSRFISLAHEQKRKGPIPQDRYPAYRDQVQRWQKLTELTEKALAERTPDALGMARYKLTQANKEVPDFAPNRLALGLVLAYQKEWQEAITQFETAIRLDQGRTSLTTSALLNIGYMSLEDGKPGDAAYALAVLLAYDYEHDKVRQLLALALEKAEYAKARELLGEVDTAKAPEAAISRQLPALPAPGPAVKPMSAEDLYQFAVPSIVLVETERATGSGFVVARNDLLLTNWHVVEGAQTINVYPFVLRRGKPVRAEKLAARVIYRDEKQDIAILQLTKPSELLLPLELAPEIPKAGTRVYAIGSPGMGNQTLDQTISDGIVSSPERRVDGQTYIQHTAAINPGNSGGPLMNASGQVVGIVTLKANMENVGFAIPSPIIRALFPK